MNQSASQSIKIERSRFRRSSLFKYLCWMTKEKSSAYNSSSLSMAYDMSLIQIKKEQWTQN